MKKHKWSKNSKAKKATVKVEKTNQDKVDTSKVEGYNEPLITIDEVELAKIRWYVDKCDVEISGIGKVIKVEPGHYHVTKIYVPEQEVSVGDTEIDDASLAKVMFEGMQDGVEGEFLYHWHSHHTMGVFWSGTDKEMIANLGKGGMIIASVFNKKRECRTAIYAGGDDMRPHFFIDELELIEHRPNLIPEADISEMEAIFKERVKEEKSLPIYGGYNAYGGTIMGDYNYDGGFANSRTVDENKFRAKAIYSTLLTEHITDEERDDIYQYSEELMVSDINTWFNLSRADRQKVIDCYASWWGQTIYASAYNDCVRALELLIELLSWYSFDIQALEQDMQQIPVEETK